MTSLSYTLINPAMQPIIPPAHVEVDENRCYVAVNDAACDLLGYSREELLHMKIDDISFPSGAHVSSIYHHYENKKAMQGVFALQRKSGEVIRVRFQAEIVGGRSSATWTHYEAWDSPPPVNQRRSL
jgi:PAS domain S-box-containing protein